MARMSGLGSVVSRTTGTAVAPFVPSKGATALQVELALQKREGLATAFIKSARFGYVRLVPAPGIAMLSARVESENLVRDQVTFQELETASSPYFAFKTDLFKFHGRKDRDAWDLLRRPQTYADLEEENIEEKFPEDLPSRALICAFDRVIAHNRWRHILRKRRLQAIFSLPLVAMSFGWPFLGQAVERAAAIAVDAPAGLGEAWSRYLTGGIATAVAVALAGALALRLRYHLDNHTNAFEHVNESSCQILANHMTRVNSDIRALFNKLMSDITSSQANLQDVSHPEWAEKAKRVFKAALWEARRIESLEHFWQLRLEKLRLFEIAGNEIGNWLSRAIAVALVAVALLLAPVVWHPATAAIAAAIWWIGRTTRRREYGFDMRRIVAQGFQETWEPFCKLGYYDKIAQEYGDCKNQIRTTLVKDVFGTGSPGGQRRSRGE
jgi:hypothetical protein